MRQYALVRVKKGQEQYYEKNVFRREDFSFIFLGEIPNMLDHAVFIGHSTGKIYSGFHLDTFEEIPEDDV